MAWIALLKYGNNYLKSDLQKKTKVMLFISIFVLFSSANV